MKMRLIVLALFVCFVLLSTAWAESPVMVRHSMTGYRMESESVVVNYTLTVKNTGDDAVSNLTLTYVPLFIPSTDKITLDLGTLDSQSELQVPVALATPLSLDRNAIFRQPLFWAGEYTDGNGNRSATKRATS